MEYFGHKTYKDEKGGERRIDEKPKPVYIPKEERTLYIDGLIPQTLYTFNISAKFMDGLWGPGFLLHVETSIDG